MQVIFARLFLFITIPNHAVFANQNKDSVGLYHTKYSEKFIVSVYQSERRFNIGIEGINGLEDAALPLQYRSEARQASGIAVDWDKISLAFDYKLDIPDSTRIRRYGTARYFNFAFGLSSDNWIVETSFRKFKGFYDYNSPAYLAGFKSEKSTYYQNPDLSISAHKLKFLWFTNKNRFSQKAAYNGIYRQLKSAAAWTLVSNIGWTEMSSSVALIPELLRQSYQDTLQVNGFRALHYSIGGGASATLVILKRVFINLSLWAGPDMQWLSVSDMNGLIRFHPNISYFIESRFSMGFNARNFFVLITSMTDASYFIFSNNQISPSFISGAIEVGYRFPELKGKWIKKLKEHKWYRNL